MKKHSKKLFFPLNISHYRAINSLTQAALGKAIGVTRTAISGYESGRSTPTLNTFLQLAEMINVTPTELLFCDIFKSQNTANEMKNSIEAPITREEFLALQTKLTGLEKELVSHSKMINEFRNEVYETDNQNKELKKELRSLKKIWDSAS